MNTTLTNTVDSLAHPGSAVGALYPQMLEIYQAIAQMNVEFKEGVGIDYLVRLLMKTQKGEEPALMEKRFLKAFAPTSKASRLYGEYRGSVTGAQKALNALAGYERALANLGALVNKESKTVFASDGLLCPDIISFCGKNRIKAGLRQWIGLSEALGYTRAETTALVRELTAMAQHAKPLEKAFLEHVKTITSV